MSEGKDGGGTIQAAGRVASEVVNGLKSSPTILGLIVLNAAAIAAAIWFLNHLVELSMHRFDQVQTMQQKLIEMLLTLCKP